MQRNIYKKNQGGKTMNTETIVLDLSSISKGLKTTEFITDHNIPNKILVTNGYYCWSFCYGEEREKGSMKEYKIDIILEKKSLGNNRGETSRVNKFSTTYYSLTNLRKLCEGGKAAIGAFDDIYKIYDEIIESDGVLPKGTKKEQMLEYLIMKHLTTEESPKKLKKPIKVVVQDTDLREQGYGKSYTYYITEVYIKDVVYNDIDL